MMLRTSSNKLNPAVNMYRQTVRRSVGIVILVTLFLLLVCPSYVLVHINNSLATSNNGFFAISFPNKARVMRRGGKNGVRVAVGRL